MRGHTGEVVAALGRWPVPDDSARGLPPRIETCYAVRFSAAAQISVWDSTSEARYMVLPARPAGTGALDAGQLTALVTRNGLIGTALV